MNQSTSKSNHLEMISKISVVVFGLTDSDFEVTVLDMLCIFIKAADLPDPGLLRFFRILPHFCKRIYDIKHISMIPDFQ